MTEAAKAAPTKPALSDLVNISQTAARGYRAVAAKQ